MSNPHTRALDLAHALVYLWDLQSGSEHEVSEAWPQAKRAVDLNIDDYVLSLVEAEITVKESELWEEGKS